MVFFRSNFLAIAMPSMPLELIDQCTSQGATILLDIILSQANIAPAIEVMITTPIIDPYFLRFKSLLALASIELFSNMAIVGKICHNPKISEDITIAVIVLLCCSSKPSRTPLNKTSSINAVPKGTLIVAS